LNHSTAAAGIPGCQRALAQCEPLNALHALRAT
jgi:hypothetical protein